MDIIVRNEAQYRGDLAIIQQHWIPYRISWETRNFAPTSIEWCYLGEQRFTAPFFEDTIRQCLRSSQIEHHIGPLHTELDILQKVASNEHCIAPSGFIFHMSRCGSTLISQMLACLDQNVVFSEAPPIDELIRLIPSRPSEEEHAALLRTLINAMGQKRFPYENHLFIKFDCWHILDFELIDRAFPHVPKVFLYRNPAEVMVSLMQSPSLTLVPGTIDPGKLNLTLNQAIQESKENYCARILGAFLETAVSNQDKLTFVNYNQLPDIVYNALMNVWNVEYTPADIERMRHITQFHAKTPQLYFADDRAEKTQRLTNAMSTALAQFCEVPYQMLETIRSARDSIVKQPTI